MVHCKYVSVISKTLIMK